MQYHWPRVFTEPDFDYAKEEPEETRRALVACSDGLVGWGNCCAGEHPPAGFGKGMVKIGEAAGCSAEAKTLTKRAKALRRRLH